MVKLAARPIPSSAGCYQNSVIGNQCQTAL